MDGYESRWHSRALSWGGWMGSTSPPGRTAWRWRIMSFGGRGSHCGERASGNEPLTRPAKQGRGLAEASPRDLRHSPGPRGGHAATETDRRQPRQPTSEVPETNGSNVSGTNQLVLESIDTVGVTGSIPVSPTTKTPESGAFVVPEIRHVIVCQRDVNRIRRLRMTHLNIGRHQTTRWVAARDRCNDRQAHAVRPPEPFGPSTWRLAHAKHS